MAERFEIMEKALLQMLESKKYSTLRDMLITMNPSDVAGIFSDLEEKQVPLMFRLLPKELAAETFVEMEPDTQALLIQGFSDNELKEVLSVIPSNILTKVIIEINCLTDEEMLKACELVIASGADFVKTGTGWVPAPLDLERIRKIKDFTRGKIKLKVAGGIRTKEDFLAMVDMGVERFGIGTKSALEIVQSFE